MSPLPRRGRSAAVLLLVCLVFSAAFLAAIGAPAGAQEGNETGDADGNQTGDANGTGENQTGDAPADGAPVRELLVAAEEIDCGENPTPCWDIVLFAVKPGEQVSFTASFEGAAQPHDLEVQLPDGAQKVPPSPAIGGLHTLEFTAPEDFEQVQFICTVHPTTMIGNLVTPAGIAEGAAADHDAIPQLGVNFLAYWVGLIAFALLFIVYGLTFFLFKYNETPATTDHWDRPGDGGGRMGAGTTSILALVLAAVVMGGVIYFAVS